MTRALFSDPVKGSSRRVRRRAHRGALTTALLLASTLAIPATPAAATHSALAVNSTADNSDTNPGDGTCDTGQLNTQGQPECTLRAAIEEANSHPNNDIVLFTIPTTDPQYNPSPLSFQITPATPLPTITEPAQLIASSQNQYTTLTRPVIELDTNNTTQPALHATAQVTINGFNIHSSTTNAIQLDTEATNSTITNNYIGTDPTGHTPKPNHGNGIETNAANTTITNNTISASHNNGIVLGPNASNTTITNNNHIDTTTNTNQTPDQTTAEETTIEIAAETTAEETTVEIAAEATATGDVSPAACTDTDTDGLCDLEEDANTDLDNDPATTPGPDTDGDTTPNYLDPDDDGDGTPTSAENADPNADGDPRDALDSDWDGQPDYLDLPITVATDGTVGGEQKISDTVGGLSAVLDDTDRFGSSTTSIGDVDGDGIVDVAVGADLDDDGGTNRGAVYVLFLNADGTVKAEQKISSTTGGLTGPLDDNDWFGQSVAGVGDLDGDGIADIAVGARNDDDGGANRGAVYVLFLNADGTVKAEQKISSTTGGLTGPLDDTDGIGISVAGVGDVDGDGIADITVGANADDDGGADRGAVYVLFLNADGTVK
ncbi:MAG: CSLREA domain-containing protein, partial [Actinomycetia bacterium]|nr:CSLREA domain-containing protein [Actinomycetes bacterium]